MKVEFCKGVSGTLFSFRKREIVTVGERNLDAATANGFIESGICKELAAKKPAPKKRASKAKPKTAAKD